MSLLHCSVCLVIVSRGKAVKLFRDHVCQANFRDSFRTGLWKPQFRSSPAAKQNIQCVTFVVIDDLNPTLIPASLEMVGMQRNWKKNVYHLSVDGSSREQSNFNCWTASSVRFVGYVNSDETAANLNLRRCRPSFGLFGPLTCKKALKHAASFKETPVPLLFLTRYFCGFFSSANFNSSSLQGLNVISGANIHECPLSAKSGWVLLIYSCILGVIVLDMFLSVVFPMSAKWNI